MRAMRYEQVISDASHRLKQSDVELSLLEKGDYLTEQMIENRRKSGILKNTAFSSSNKPFHTEYSERGSGVNSSTKSFAAAQISQNVIDGRNTHLGFVMQQKQPDELKNYFNEGADRDRAPSAEYAT